MKKTIRFTKRKIGAAIFATLILAGGSACGNSESKTETTTAATTTATKKEDETKGETKAPTSEASIAAPTGGAAEGVYPLADSPELTYWFELPTNNSTVVQNFEETEFAKALEEQTGIKVTYTHPPAAQAKETFNVLVASNDLPDIIEYRWVTDFPGGVTAALQNKVIISLNDQMADFAPSFTAYLESNPSIDRQIKTDDGIYSVFPFIRGDKYLQTTSGGMVRKDWLDELNLDIPETMDDWEVMLTAFKDEKGATAPYTAVSNNNIDNLSNMFSSAYKFRFAASSAVYYMDGNTVKYAPLEPAYKDFLEKMNDWYNKGLIDKNFTLVDRKTLDANILNGTSGACYGPGGGGMGVWMEPGKEQTDTYDLVAVPSPVLNAGDEIEHFGSSYEFTQSSPGMAAITNQCDNVEAAMRLLDYAFSEEGHILYNFGVEGESFEYVAGVPTYTELVMKNPNDLSVAQAMAHYSRANSNGPFAQDPGYLLQYYEMPQQKDALETWSIGDNRMQTIVPPTSFTQEESSKHAALIADISTYVTEMTVKFVMGAENFDNYDKFVEQLHSMKIDDAIALQQAAVDRYFDR